MSPEGGGKDARKVRRIIQLLELLLEKHEGTPPPVGCPVVPSSSIRLYFSPPQVAEFMVAGAPEPTDAVFGPDAGSG